MKKSIILVFLTLIGFAFTYFKAEKQYIPKDGFVPNEQTALKIAEAILIPIYGKKSIDSQRPLTAKLNKDGTSWYVSGTLPEGYVGGVAHIEIQKSDCKIIEVYGTK